jgi:Coiled-coil domain-containing protein 55 (DUF2040)
MIRRRGRGKRSPATGRDVAGAPDLFNGRVGANGSSSSDLDNDESATAPRSASTAALVAAAAEAAAFADAARARRRLRPPVAMGKPLPEPEAEASVPCSASGMGAGVENNSDVTCIVKPRDDGLPAAATGGLTLGGDKDSSVVIGMRAAPTANGSERKSRYIDKLVRQAAVRKDAAEAALDRKLAKERDKEDTLFPDKERFVTSAYKTRLAEREEAQRDDDRAPTRASPMPTEFFGKILLNAQRGRHQSIAGDNHSGVSRKRQRTLPDNLSPDEIPAQGQHIQDGGRDCRAEIVEDKPDDRRKNDVSPPLVRGLRRNNEESIEAYRQRYYARRDNRDKTTIESQSRASADAV